MRSRRSRYETCCVVVRIAGARGERSAADSSSSARFMVPAWRIVRGAVSDGHIVRGGRFSSMSAAQRARSSRTPIIDCTVEVVSVPQVFLEATLEFLRPQASDEARGYRLEKLEATLEFPKPQAPPPRLQGLEVSLG